MFPGNVTLSRFMKLALPVVLLLVSPAAVHAQSTPEPQPAPVAATVAKDASFANPSLFFTPEEINSIRTAINVYEGVDSGEGQDFLTKLTGIENPNAPKQKRIYVYPQFHLESIIYRGRNDWIAWINNQKLSNAGPALGEIRIMDIDRGHVMVQWTPANMKRVLQSWDPLAETFVQVDTGQGTVTFTLRPNQTFSSYRMKVLEGKVVPVQVEETVSRTSTTQAEAPVSLPASETPAAVVPPPVNDLPSVPAYIAK